MDPIPANTTAFVLDATRVVIRFSAEGHVSFTGDYDGAGQIVDRLREALLQADESVASALVICDVWDDLHLKATDRLTNAEIERLHGASRAMDLMGGRRLGDVPLDELDEADDEVRPGSDVLDSRDVVRRTEQLEGGFILAGLDPAEVESDSPYYAQAQDLLALRALEAESPSSAWTFGATLIHAAYFEDWCMGYLAEIGILPDDLPDFVAIDYAKTAEAMKADYHRVYYGEHAYYIRED